MCGRPAVVRPATGRRVDRAAIRYGGEVAEAWSHAHARGIVHRDLKSANVMVSSDGRVKVLDFGLARRLDPEEVDTLTQSTSGALVGTPAYMAPEVLRGDAVDRRADLWAVGVVLYELMSARRPFEGATLFELSSAILRDEPTSLPERVRGCFGLALCGSGQQRREF